MTDIQLPPFPWGGDLTAWLEGRNDAEVEEQIQAYARAAIEAHEARKVPDGWQLVPIEPTLEMVGAWKTVEQQAATEVLYRTMLASAPPAPQASKKPLFGELIAQHEGLAEELKTIDAEVDRQHGQASVVKQEPVAFRVRSVFTEGAGPWRYFSGPESVHRHDEEIELLYTHPAPVREPLTPEQIRKWWASENGLEDCDMAKIDDFTQVVRAVEAFIIQKGCQ